MRNEKSPARNVKQSDKEHPDVDVHQIDEQTLRALGINTENLTAQRIELLSEIQSIRLPLPPPEILEQYKKIDPRILEELLSSVKEQREHRHSLERESTLRLEARQDKAQRYQQIISIVCIVAGVTLAGIPPFFGQSTQIMVPLGLIIVGVGGRPAATIISQLLAKSSRHMRDGG